MGLIKEPLEIDFYVEPSPLTEEEKLIISQYIREYKAHHKKNTAIVGQFIKPIDERPRPRV